LARRSGITPAIATRLAVALAIDYCSKANEGGSGGDVTIGIVRSGRDIEVDGSEEMIGCLVSVLPSRIIASKSGSTLLQLALDEMKMDRLSRVHQGVSLADLIKITSARTDRLFNILFTYQSLADRISTSIHPFPIQQPPLLIRMPTGYSMSFEVTPLGRERLGEQHESYELGCFFDDRIIGREEVGRVLSTISRILDYMISDPGMNVKEMDLGSIVVDTTPRISLPSSCSTEVEVRGMSEDSLGMRNDAMIKLRGVWQTILKIRKEIGGDESFSALGGDSVNHVLSGFRNVGY
jgi:hypothetical protein